ncbi:unnamed protein product, partial [Protopolystoma xenopodis]
MCSKAEEVRDSGKMRGSFMLFSTKPSIAPSVPETIKTLAGQVGVSGTGRSGNTSSSSCPLYRRSVSSQAFALSEGRRRRHRLARQLYQTRETRRWLNDVQPSKMPVFSTVEANEQITKETAEMLATDRLGVPTGRQPLDETDSP